MSQIVLRDPNRTAIILDQYADAPPETISAWAKAWGVSRDSIRHRAAYLGVRRSEAAKGASLSRGQHERQGSVVAYEPPCLNRDDEYVAACLAEGGFGRYLETRGERGVVRLTGPYVPFAAERNARRSQVTR